VDETGVDPKSIVTVVDFLKCKRSAAVHALREKQNDVIDAIMVLTPGITNDKRARS